KPRERIMMGKPQARVIDSSHRDERVTAGGPLLIAWSPIGRASSGPRSPVRDPGLQPMIVGKKTGYRRIIVGPCYCRCMKRLIDLILGLVAAVATALLLGLI